MGAHAEFIFRLVDLVEYAENNDLEVASLALNAAVEVIAPSIARSIAQKIAQPCATRPALPPKLRVIEGGLMDGQVPARLTVPHISLPRAH